MIIIDGIVFKKYDDNYFVSANGDIWSKRSGRILKHEINKGYHRVYIHGKHVSVHKLVYLTWIGTIPDGMQINHIDDDKNNNYYTNLYLGSQKDNVEDCIKNGHRVGHVLRLTVREKDSGEILVFVPAKTFLEFSGHMYVHGYISDVINRDWFNEAYELIELEKVKSLKDKNEKN